MFVGNSSKPLLSVSFCLLANLFIVSDGSMIEYFKDQLRYCKFKTEKNLLLTSEIYTGELH